jgi:hypothetical protein
MSTGRPFLHSALLYATPAGYLAATVPFVRDGLKRGEPVLVAVPPANGDLLRTALGRTADRVRFLDMTEAGRNPDRIVPWVLRAFVDRYASRRVRVVGEPIWPGRAPEEVPISIAQLNQPLPKPQAPTRDLVLCDLVQTYTAPTGTTTRLHMRLP